MYSEFIKNVFLKRVVLVLLTLVTMVSFSFISYTLIRSNLYVLQSKNDLQQLIKKDVFMGNDRTSSDQIDYIFDEKNSKKSNKKAQKLFNYIDHNYDYSSSWSDQIDMPNGYRNIEIYTINSNFFKFYPLKVKKGRLFSKSDYIGNKKEIPVIVGAGLRKVKLGSTFKDLNQPVGKKETYKVIGILKENTRLPSAYMLDGSYMLNKTIFRPLTDKDKKHINVDQLTGMYQDLLIYNTSKAKVSKLSKTIRKENLGNVKFYSIKENIKFFYSTYNSRALLYLVLSLVMLIIFIGLFLWNIWKSLSESRQEIAIRISLGLRKYHLYIITFLYQLLLTIFSFIPVTIYAVRNSYVLATDRFDDQTQIILSSPLPKIESISLILSFLILLVIGTFSSMLIIYKFNKSPLTLRMGSDS